MTMPICIPFRNRRAPSSKLKRPKTFACGKGGKDLSAEEKEWEETYCTIIIMYNHKVIYKINKPKKSSSGGKIFMYS